MLEIRAELIRYNARMTCPKCGVENPGKVQFCVRCHTPLWYTCPACRHTQDHGGLCDKCGVDFAKYAALMVSHAQERAQRERDVSRQRGSVYKQILLLPITCGLSLLSYLRSLRERD